MIDLVLEEQRLEHLVGLPLERLLKLLEARRGGDLLSGYEYLVDRYLVLTGKGRRRTEEQVELDRLASGLHLLFGPEGLLACTGHLLGLAAQLQALPGSLPARPGRRHLEAALTRLLAALARCRSGLARPPVPVDQQNIQAGLERAATLLMAARRALPPTRPRRWLVPGWQGRGWLELYRQVAQNPPRTDAWPILEALRTAREHELPRTLLVLAAHLAACDVRLRVEASLETCAELVGESLSPVQGG